MFLGLSSTDAGAVDTAQTGACTACILLDNDASSKLVRWCGLCQAWLCDRCRLNPLRRAQAMLRRQYVG